MSDVNVVAMSGRLTRDSESRYSAGGMAILKFSLANGQNKKVGDKWEKVSHFFDCTMLGKRAESLAQYLKKGTQVVIAGTLQLETWEKDGEKRSKVSILVNDLTLVGGGQHAQVNDDEVVF